MVFISDCTVDVTASESFFISVSTVDFTAFRCSPCFSISKFWRPMICFCYEMFSSFRVLTSLLRAHTSSARGAAFSSHGIQYSLRMWDIASSHHFFGVRNPSVIDYCSNFCRADCLFRGCTFSAMLVLAMCVLDDAGSQQCSSFKCS